MPVFEKKVAVKPGFDNSDVRGIVETGWTRMFTYLYPVVLTTSSFNNMRYRHCVGDWLENEKDCFSGTLDYFTSRRLRNNFYSSIYCSLENAFLRYLTKAENIKRGQKWDLRTLNHLFFVPRTPTYIFFHFSKLQY